MEDEAMYKEKLLLPTAPRAARGSDVDESKIPCNPPYTAYIANLPYDIDNDDVEKFFQGLSVKSVRLPREGGDSGRLRGFGYAEFETRQDLVDALTRNELVIKNRKIRVDVASGTDNDQDQGMGGDMMGAGRGRGRPPRDESREDRTPNDWRNAPREMPAPGPDRFRSERGDRGGERGDRGDREEQGSRYDAGFNPRERAPGSSSAASSFGGSGGSSFGRRDGPSSFTRESRDRNGPSSYGRDRDGGASSFNRDRDGGASSFTRDRDGGASSFGRDRDGPSSFSRDRDGPSSFGRDRDGPSSFSRDREDGPPMNREPAKERPKMMLQKRTVPVEESAVAAPVAKTEAAASSASSASIFGGARPVDTAARERAIEERLKEKREKEREPVRGRDRDRQDDRQDRDGSRGSAHSSDRRGRSVETEQSYRKDQDDRRRDNAVPKSNEYQAPRGGGEGREYRGAPRGNDRDNRYSREGNYRANRGNNRDDSRRENGDSRAPAYRPPNSSSRPNQQRTTDDRTRSHENPAAGHSPSSKPSDEEARIRRMEEPKAPIFENRNKFAYLVEDDVESEGQDDQE